MKNIALTSLFLGVFFISLSVQRDRNAFAGEEVVTASLISDRESVQPGGKDSLPSARIGVLFEIAKGWHIYWFNSGDAGMPTRVRWKLPDGWTAGELKWPVPVDITEKGNLRTRGYFNSVLLQSNLYPVEEIPSEDELIEIGAEVSWLACKDICIPGSATLKTRLKFSSVLPLEPSSYFDLFEHGRTDTNVIVANASSVDRSIADSYSWTGLVRAIICAFVAGLLLNFMPCVLPIISIKVLGFIKQAHASRLQRQLSAWAFSAGILFSFLVLAIAVNILSGVGREIGWGFQFQEPVFVFILMLVVFVLSLGFFDIYTFRLPYMQEAHRFTSRLTPSLAQHFMDGILATALATPCTAPFLGTALAFAFVQSSLSTIIIFLSIGLGLSLPYVLCCAFPIALKFLPKPGPWMNRFRQLMGFSLLGTAIWLLFVLDRLTEDGTIWAVVLAALFYFCVWLTHWVHEASFSKVVKDVFITAIYVAFFFVFYNIWPNIGEKRMTSIARPVPVDKISWEVFSLERLEEAKASGAPVFINFTADWCITCKVNKRFFLETESVARELKNGKFVTLLADWTSGDKVITQALNSFGGKGVPYYVVIPGNSVDKPIILPTVFTEAAVVEVLKKVSSLQSLSSAGSNQG